METEMLTSLTLQIKPSKIVGISPHLYNNIFDLGIKSFRTLEEINANQEGVEYPENNLSGELIDLGINTRNEILELEQKVRASHETEQQKLEATETLTQEMCNKLNKLLFCSAKKGSVGEQSIENILASNFIDSSIIDTSKTAHSGDFELVKGSSKILFEVKNYGETVPTTETEKFVRDVVLSDCDSFIFVSMGERIAQKPRVSVELCNEKPIVYLSEFESDESDSLISIVLMLRELKYLQPESENSPEICMNSLKQKIEHERKSIVQFKTQLEKQLKTINDMILHEDAILDQLEYVDTQGATQSKPLKTKPNKISELMLKDII